MPGAVYHALIRTHHITSRKKIARLKAAAKQYQCYALLRSGGNPGVMYVRGSDRSDVQKWIDTVHNLRYKDYQLVAPVHTVLSEVRWELPQQDDTKLGYLEEVETVKEMATHMEARGLQRWWRVAMGFLQE